MQCPNTSCGYQHGYLPGVQEKVYGTKGDFYQITNDIGMERVTPHHWERDECDIYGCPACGMIFMKVD